MDDRHAVAVAVVGRDRPGIVAGISKVLYEHGCNLEDATSTILGGHFAMMLLVRLPEAHRVDELERSLQEAGRALGVTTMVSPLGRGVDQVVQPTHLISVYGADRPGIVFRVTDLLARAGASITALTSKVIGEPEAPVYALMLEAHVADAAAIESDLERLRAELDLEATMRPIESDLL